MAIFQKNRALDFWDLSGKLVFKFKVLGFFANLYR
jgi:hypothetical protein